MSTSAYISAIIIGLIRLVASLSLTYLLVHFRRRSLYLASALGTILSLATFSTILLLSEHLIDWELGIPQTALSWLSLVSACCLVFSVNLGVGPMPYLMSSELYPSDIRAFCMVFSIEHSSGKMQVNGLWEIVPAQNTFNCFPIPDLGFIGHEYVFWNGLS